MTHTLKPGRSGYIARQRLLSFDVMLSGAGGLAGESSCEVEASLLAIRKEAAGHANVELTGKAAHDVDLASTFLAHAVRTG